MLERGCNPELFWDVHTLVLPALQQELTQLTFDEIQACSHIFEYKQNASQEVLCTEASPASAPYSLFCSSLHFQGWAGSGLAAGSAVAALAMGAVQGGSTSWELC